MSGKQDKIIKIGDYAKGTVIGNHNQVTNVFYPQKLEPIRQKLLANVKKQIEYRLSHSLRSDNLINLLKHERPSQVISPWEMKVDFKDSDGSQQPEEVSIIEFFDRKDVSGNLLLLGEPGAGKTTTLLILAKELILRAEMEVNEPLPILLNLSSWKNNKKTLDYWMLTEMEDKYGVRFDIGQKLLKSNQLLPLLDSLDEVDSASQEKCVQSINHFQKVFHPKYFVVSCRKDEYEYLNTKLRLNTAIYLQPMTNEQIGKYLDSSGHIVLWDDIKDDYELLNLAKTPFLLAIMSVTFSQISISEKEQLTSHKSRYKFLFDSYIQRMLGKGSEDSLKNNKLPSPEKTKYWLGWLAQKLYEQGSSELMV